MKKHVTDSKTTLKKIFRMCFGLLMTAILILSFVIDAKIPKAILFIVSIVFVLIIMIDDIKKNAKLMEMRVLYIIKTLLYPVMYTSFFISTLYDHRGIFNVIFGITIVCQGVLSLIVWVYDE